MSRRASSGMSPAALGGVAVAVLIAFFAGKSLLSKKHDNNLGDASKLRIQDVLENANALRGNEYIVEGKVDQKLFWDATLGQVISLQVDDNGHSEFTVIEIPPTQAFNKLNIEREQRYAFKVKFRDGGIPVASAINRL